jgi:hypothetical protein
VVGRGLGVRSLATVVVLGDEQGANSERAEARAKRSLDLVLKDFQQLPPAVHDEGAHAFGGEDAGDLPPDAHAASGHDGGPVAKLQVHRCPLLVSRRVEDSRIVPPREMLARRRLPRGRPEDP